MPKCNFLLAFKGEAADIEKKLKAEIEAYNGTLDTTAKSISIKIPVVGALTGSYDFEGQQIRIIIDSKPMLLSCDQIEKQLTGFLAEA